MKSTFLGKELSEAWNSVNWIGKSLFLLSLPMLAAVILGFALFAITAPALDKIDLWLTKVTAKK